MSDLKISNLSSAGSDLFQDSESFLTELEGTSITQEIMGGSGKRGGQTIFYANNYGGYGGGYGGYGRGGYGGYGGYGRGGYGRGGYGGSQIFFASGGNGGS